MGSEIDALRAAMKAAQPSGKGVYIEAGQHVLDIDRAFVKRSMQGGMTKESWIVEFKVVSSTNPTHEVGSTRSYVENPANQGWMERFKSFLSAAVGADPTGKISAEDEITISDVTVALRFDEYRIERGWPENFLKGRRLHCEGMAGVSKSGGPVTNKKWTPAPSV